MFDFLDLLDIMEKNENEVFFIFFFVMFYVYQFYMKLIVDNIYLLYKYFLFVDFLFDLMIRVMFICYINIFNFQVFCLIY